MIRFFSAFIRHFLHGVLPRGIRDCPTSLDKHSRFLQSIRTHLLLKARKRGSWRVWQESVACGSSLVVVYEIPGN